MVPITVSSDLRNKDRDVIYIAPEASVYDVAREFFGE